jgi:hypothetical protein
LIRVPLSEWDYDPPVPISPGLWWVIAVCVSLAMLFWIGMLLWMLS